MPVAPFILFFFAFRCVVDRIDGRADVLLSYIPDSILWRHGATTASMSSRMSSVAKAEKIEGDEVYHLSLLSA